MKAKDELPACPVATAISLIGGKLRRLQSGAWKPETMRRYQ